MAETTPLLSRPIGSAYDLPMSLRVCRSPWPFVNQRALLAVRAVIASFLTVVFALSIFYGIDDTRRGQQWVFEASNVSLVIQIFYYWITTSWVLQDILAPYNRLPQEEQARGRFVAQIKAGLSAPTATETYPKRYFVFSNFYTAAVTFPFTISAAYWLVLHPLNPVLGRGGKGEALHHFEFISITALNSVVTLLEVMVLSSVRKQKDLATQVTGVIAIYLLYAIWTVFGYYCTGEYVHKYFDPDCGGWGGVATTDIVILSLTITTLFAQRGLHTLREILVRRFG